MAKLGYRIGRQIVGSHELLSREHGSECVASLDYDIERQAVTCEFVKRGTYVYFDVEPEVYAEWNMAGSRGIYFNLYVKDRYSYDRIG
jgi:hypothetical protein